MTRESDFMDVLKDYLDEHEGHTPLPVEAREAVRARLPSITQRPAWWPTRRQPPMNTYLKFSLAAAAVAVVAVLGFNYIATPTGTVNTGAGGDDASPSSTTASQPTSTPIPRLAASGPLEAGTYQANAFIPVDVLVTVPEGWISGGDWLLYGPLGPDAPRGMNIRFGSVTNLFADPEDRAAGLMHPPVGPTVDDLVAAMTSHADWPTSDPTDVSIDGYSGKVVRLTLPPDEAIPPGGFLLFKDAQDGDRWAWAAGQIVDFYIIDVEGERLVLELFSYPDTPATDLAARQAVVDSLQLSR